MIDTISKFFESMPAVQQVLWYIAIPSTIVFLIMMALTFVGMDGADGIDTDMDADVDSSGDAFQLWTFRNLVVFLSVFSWSALSFLDSGKSFTSAMIFSTILGTVVVFALSALFFFMHRMQQDNTPKIKEILNRNAIVYLTVPERGNGVGKINVEYGGAIREVKAVSMNRAYKNGESVKVVDLQGDLAFVDEVK